MSHDRYSLPPGRARLVRVLALVFLLLGAHRTVTLALPLTAPAYMGIAWDYDAGKVRFGPDPLVLLPVPARASVVGDSAAHSRYLSRLDDPAVRLRLFLVELAARLPELALMYCLGIAFWRSSRLRAEAALGGVPWLFRASVAGLALALVTPVAEALRTGLLLNGVIPTATFDFNLDLDSMQRSLLLAAAALAATWTIGSALRARAELAEIV